MQKTLSKLEENLPYDGLFFDIHGAMSVVGMDDPEGDFIIRVRKVVGTETLISTSMDLHGNVSQRLAENTDLITCYRMAPHEDAIESKKRPIKPFILWGYIRLREIRNDGEYDSASKARKDNPRATL